MGVNDFEHIKVLLYLLNLLEIFNHCSGSLHELIDSDDAHDSYRS